MRTIYESEDKQWRVTETEDECFEMEDLKGDCFNPKAFPGTEAAVLQAEEKHFESKVQRNGVYGYALEKKCGECGTFKHVDSCWGFVGMYDPNSDEFNHYIVEELKGQIK